MHTPHPPRPLYPPRPAMPPGESDESLGGQLRGRPEGAAPHPVALLMARHWESTYDYAVICLASSANVASIVTAGAFQQVVGRLMRSGSAAAVRPALLVAVRDTVREWSAEERISGVLPELRKPAGGRGMRAAKSLTPENRVLAERSFLTLPGLSRCLLWHTEVEAESISVPAGLSGIGTDTATAALEQAREQFREGCVRAHRELAPTKECRLYNRLLDVPIRRGGALLPDVQRHLLGCRFCRNAAEQLSHFEGALGGLLAEAVLGWGARRYLESRPGRTPYGGRARGVSGSGGRPGSGGRHRLLAQIPAPGRRTPVGERGARAVLTGVGIASAAVLATFLVTGLWSNDDGNVDPTASTSASGGRTTVLPTPGSQIPPTVSSPPDSAGLPTTPRQTRLRNLAADLCLDVRGEAKAGAGTKLAVCSSAWTQQWTYEKDGLLRSVADPELCLDSGAVDGVAELGRCVAESSAHGGDVRYDLTVQGEVLSRRKGSLAVTPGNTDPDADIVVKVRDGSDKQRWLTDSPSDQPESLSIAGTTPPSATPATDAPAATPAPTPVPASPGTRLTDAPVASSAPPSENYGERRSLTVTDTSTPEPVLPLTVHLPDLLGEIGVGL
ncbi:hydrolase [Streptomyces avermitilis]|nr:hydrolase [Streptomyces avermitilis]MYT03017.1 hydrolase [Streptomyces sp. SID5469]GDY81056.1 hydrolase [Streptomyces avermitilis]